MPSIEIGDQGGEETTKMQAQSINKLSSYAAFHIAIMTALRCSLV